ncbi:hypothetical protein ACTXT7_000431 [Hymenolepis weldensis]
MLGLLKKSFVPTTVLLNDTITSNHFYICTYGYLGPSSILSVPTTVLIDVRDLLADNTPESTVIDEVNNRITYVKQSFSQAVKATKAFSLLMVEDKTGVYGIASKMGISVILAEANDIKEIAKPDLDSVDYVFFVSKKTLQNIFHASVIAVLDCSKLFVHSEQIVTITASFKQVKMDSPSGLLMDFSEPLPVGVGYGILAFSILKLLSLTSIAAAGLIVIKNHEELEFKRLLLVHKTRPNSRANPFLKAIVPALFILCVISLILLAYFFFDIMECIKMNCSKNISQQDAFFALLYPKSYFTTCITSAAQPDYLVSAIARNQKIENLCHKSLNSLLR